MDLFVRKFKIKVPLFKHQHQLNSCCLLLIVAVNLILVNGIKCSDNLVRSTSISSSSHASGAGSLISSGSHAVENVHKMLSHAMSETINNEFGSK